MIEAGTARLLPLGSTGVQHDEGPIAGTEFDDAAVTGQLLEADVAGPEQPGSFCISDMQMNPAKFTSLWQQLRSSVHESVYEDAGLQSVTPAVSCLRCREPV